MRYLCIFRACLCILLAGLITSVQAVPFLPAFDASNFVPGTLINNPYFPMLDFSNTYIYEGEFFDEDEGEFVTERFSLTNLNTGPVILGVQTTTQLDRAFEDELLVEETFDYYAQDIFGHVWYMGEDVTNYIYDDEGNLIEINNESAWRAGVNGALPGYIMVAAASLSVGFEYYQEFAAADEALDIGEIFAIGEFVSIAFGDFTGVLRILETNPFEPDARGFKYFAPGFGLILEEEGLDEEFQNPELAIELIEIRSIPEPASIILFGLGLFGLVFARRKEA